MNELEKRCVELSYHHKLTHVSSVLNTVNVLADIYAKRAEDDPVVLGNSHAALALFVVLEHIGMCDAEEMIQRHGTHAARDMEHGVWVSGGSLGQAETVAVGMAMASKSKTVWLVTSDGAAMEGAVYEAMRTARNHCPNLKTFIIFNGTGAYTLIHPLDLPINSLMDNVTVVNRTGRLPQWLQGIPGHYLTLSKEQFEELMA